MKKGRLWAGIDEHIPTVAIRVAEVADGDVDTGHGCGWLSVTAGYQEMILAPTAEVNMLVTVLHGTRPRS